MNDIDTNVRHFSVWASLPSRVLEKNDSFLLRWDSQSNGVLLQKSSIKDNQWRSHHFPDVGTWRFATFSSWKWFSVTQVHSVISHHSRSYPWRFLQSVFRWFYACFTPSSHVYSSDALGTIPIKVKSSFFMKTFYFHYFMTCNILIKAYQFHLHEFQSVSSAGHLHVRILEVNWILKSQIPRESIPSVVHYIKIIYHTGPPSPPIPAQHSWRWCSNI